MDNSSNFNHSQRGENTNSVRILHYLGYIAAIVIFNFFGSTFAFSQSSTPIAAPQKKVSKPLANGEKNNSSDPQAAASDAVGQKGATNANAVNAVAPTQTSSTAKTKQKKAKLPDNVVLPLKVGVALTVEQITRINEKENTFEAVVDLQVRWQDPSLAFDPAQEGANRKEYDGTEASKKLAEIWSPELNLLNLKDKPDRSEPGLFIYSDGTVLYIHHIEALFGTDYNFALFPFDNQKLNIQIASTQYTSSQVAFFKDKPDIVQPNIKQTACPGGWKLIGIDTNISTMQRWNRDYYPVYEEQIVAERIPWSHMFVVVTPFLLILAVPTIMTLYTKVEPTPILTSWSGSILALIALNFTLSVRYPALDSHSLVSQLVTIGYCYQIIMVFLAITLFHPTVGKTIAGQRGSNEILKFARWVIPLGLICWIAARVFIVTVANR